MKLALKSITITDLETTGLNPAIHEIIEIGAVVVSQPELKIIKTFETKVKPKNIKNADPKALEVNGYNEKAWQGAQSISQALENYFDEVGDSIFCSYNTSFDLPFINQACYNTGIENTLDYHCIDIPSLVWLKYKNTNLEKIRLSSVATFLNIKPEPQIHTALNGAMTGYKVLQKLLLD